MAEARGWGPQRPSWNFAGKTLAERAIGVLFADVPLRIVDDVNTPADLNLAQLESFQP
ncbi:MAG TPA: hypothetical protein VLT90_06300 [Terriglobales bacterium]|nr:hypothetical protein [Terriglobales bacterium]